MGACTATNLLLCVAALFWRKMRSTKRAKNELRSTPLNMLEDAGGHVGGFDRLIQRPSSGLEVNAFRCALQNSDTNVGARAPRFCCHFQPEKVCDSVKRVAKMIQKPPHCQSPSSTRRLCNEHCVESALAHRVQRKRTRIRSTSQSCKQDARFEREVKTCRCMKDTKVLNKQELCILAQQKGTLHDPPTRRLRRPRKPRTRRTPSAAALRPVHAHTYYTLFSADLQLMITTFRHPMAHAAMDSHRYRPLTFNACASWSNRAVMFHFVLLIIQ